MMHLKRILIGAVMLLSSILGFYLAIYFIGHASVYLPMICFFAIIAYAVGYCMTYNPLDDYKENQ